MIRLDLQGPDGLLQEGWLSAPVVAYQDGEAFGWDDPLGVKTIFSDGASGVPNPLNEDAHYGLTPRTFKIAVPNGIYCVGIGLDGGTSGSAGLNPIDKIDVSMEGTLVFDDVGRLDFLALRYDDVLVSDGVLDILFADDGGETKHWSVFAIEVDPNLGKSPSCLK